MANAFEGKVVLITGANSGIGEAIAVAFQQAGATVFGLGRRQEALEAARARHPNIRWLRADVANSKEVSAAVESAVREAGRLDVVVNNAGIFQFAPLQKSTEEMVLVSSKPTFTARPPSRRRRCRRCARAAEQSSTSAALPGTSPFRAVRTTPPPKRLWSR